MTFILAEKLFIIYLFFILFKWYEKCTSCWSCNLILWKQIFRCLYMYRYIALMVAAVFIAFYCSDSKDLFINTFILFAYVIKIHKFDSDPHGVSNGDTILVWSKSMMTVIKKIDNGTLTNISGNANRMLRSFRKNYATRLREETSRERISI